MEGPFSKGKVLEHSGFMCLFLYPKFVSQLFKLDFGLEAKHNFLSTTVPVKGVSSRIKGLYYFFSSVQDVFFQPFTENFEGVKVNQWPVWVINTLLLPHKKYRDRYRLFQFFVTNGLDPEIASLFVRVLAYDIYYEQLIIGDYDKNALAHLSSMVSEVRDGTFFKKSSERGYSKVYNILSGRVE